MKKLKIVLSLIVCCAFANGQSLKQSKLNFAALQSKQQNDCISHNAVKSLHALRLPLLMKPHNRFPHFPILLLTS